MINKHWIANSVRCLFYFQEKSFLKNYFLLTASFLYLKNYLYLCNNYTDKALRANYQT